MSGFIAWDKKITGSLITSNHLFAPISIHLENIKIMALFKKCPTQLMLTFLFCMALFSSANLKAEKAQSLVDTTLAKQLLTEVKTMFANAQSEGAEAKLNNAAKIFEEAFGKENLHSADVLHQLGRLEFARQNIDKGIEYTLQASQIRQKILGFYHADVAISCDNLSKAYEFKDEIENAIVYKQKVRDIQIKLLGKEHVEVGQVIQHLEALYGKLFYYQAFEAYQAKDLTKALRDAWRSDSVYLAQKNYWWVLQLRIFKAQMYSEMRKPQMVIQTCTTSLSLIPLAGVKDSMLEVTLLNIYASSLLDLNQFDESERLYERAIQIKKKVLGESTAEIGMETSNLANLYFQKGQFSKAIQMANESIRRREKGVSPNPNLLKAYHNLAIFYEQAGLYHQAEIYMDKVDQIIKKEPAKYENFIAKFYQTNSNLQHNLGDFDKALAYNQLAELNYIKAYDSTHIEIVDLYYNRGLIAQDKNDWPGVIDEALRVLELIRIHHQDIVPRKIVDAYELLSTGYLKTNPDSALFYARLANQHCLTLIPDDEDAIANNSIHLGLAYAQLQRYKEADSLMLLGERRVRAVYGDHHIMTGNFIDNRADLLAKAGNYPAALALYDSALRAYGYSSDKTWESMIHIIPIFSSLQKRNRVLIDHYHATKEECLTPLIEQHFLEIEALSNYIRRFYQGQDTKFVLSAQFKKAANDAVEWFQSKKSAKSLEQAWFFAEKSRALSVLEAFYNTKAWQFDGITDTLRSTEENFSASIKKWQRAYESATTVQIKDSCYRMLLKTRMDHESWLKGLEKKDSSFFALKYNTKVSDIKSVQNQLEENQTLLEYFVGENNIYIFLIQPNRHEVFKVEKDIHFEQWVKELTQDGIYGFYAAAREKQNVVLKQQALKNYSSAAVKLYNTLLAPLKSGLSKKVIIIPDAVLGYVPFEALLTKAPSRSDALRTYQYLLQEHQISYCYSWSLLLEMRLKKHKLEPSEQLLAMAPFFLPKTDTAAFNSQMQTKNSRNRLVELPHSGPEIDTICSLFKGQALYGLAASLNTFLNLATKYRILHLSTHGKTDDHLADYAYLAFGMQDALANDQKLYTKDLYNLSLNADLVVLSACETATGKLHEGEGIISLARAFAYAGAKSIVTTLWQVNEESSKDLFISFYRYLANDLQMDKDEALHLAKLDFLKKAQKPELLHPFFWAGIIGIGDMNR